MWILSGWILSREAFVVEPNILIILYFYWGGFLWVDFSWWIFLNAVFVEVDFVGVDFFE